MGRGAATARRRRGGRSACAGHHRAGARAPSGGRGPPPAPGEPRAATRTEIWERAGVDVNTLPEVMEVGELVDAALIGFDRRELVTIPPLQDAARWSALQAARQDLLSDLKQAHAAARYRMAS